MGNFPKFLISFSEVTQFSSILSSSYLLIDLHKSLLQEKELQLQRWACVGLMMMRKRRGTQLAYQQPNSITISSPSQASQVKLSSHFFLRLQSSSHKSRLESYPKFFFLSFFWQWHKSFGTLLLNIKVPLSIVGLVHLSYYGGTKNYEGVLGLSLLGFCSARTITIFQS